VLQALCNVVTPLDASCEKSLLLRDLLSAKQPLKLCYPKTNHTRFYLDLKKRTFKSRTQEDYTAQFVIDAAKTNDRRVVCGGSVSMTITGGWI